MDRPMPSPRSDRRGCSALGMGLAAGAGGRRETEVRQRESLAWSATAAQCSKATSGHDDTVQPLQSAIHPLHSTTPPLSLSHHGRPGGDALPAQGRHWRLYQGHHDHHQRWRIRFHHPEHPDQAELWRHGRLQQVWHHHCRLRYAAGPRWTPAQPVLIPI